ncbi:unnamed protein product [Rotaria sordida]|uniref:Uncharacterized protein n=1 Tax=Rotaria sordida TaxID=392033 RepID=A0A814P5K7_9BILA|nr:unnamed protein product [Rotaria sordida]CAF3951453.1 unnamed protein product [Rotaria sordida]
MNTEKLKSNKTRLKSNENLRQKSTEYLFQPIVQTNDINNQHKPPSPFQTGLKYLKLLGQIKRQNENISIDTSEIKSTIIDRLECTSAFSTNLINKSIQVDNFDELSYKTAINNNNNNYYYYSNLSFYEFLFSSILLLLFISIILFIQLNSYPIHCLINKKFWYYSNDLSNGFQCENTNIEIYYFEIYSIIYQIEIKKNFKSINCLGFDILSCLPIDYLLIPKGHIIHRNDQLIKYCNYTQKIHCQNQSLNILPYEYKWNLKNNHFHELFHCSCLTYSNNTKCFHFKINNQCDLYIPWFNYCFKHSTTSSICQAYIKKL